MKWLFIIDPLERINPILDTTYCMMQEACSRGINVLYTLVEGLRFDKGVRTEAIEMTLRDTMLVCHKARDVQLDGCDLIFMRKEPPYDLRYHYALQLLSLTQTPVVNDPQALRDFNEKLLILHFPKWAPPMLVASDKGAILNFLNIHGVIILKALTSLQSRQVRKLEATASDKDTTIDAFTENGQTPVMVQCFLPEIEAGNKRIILLNGELLGAYNCVPAPGSYLTSIHRDGLKVEKAGITKQEQSMIQALAPFLRTHGLSFVGVDTIGGFLSEINITCPGSLTILNQTTQQRLEDSVIDYFQRLAKSPYSDCSPSYESCSPLAKAP